MQTDTALGTPEQLANPDYTPPLAQFVPLGLQHILAMFVSNVTPAIIIAGAAGLDLALIRLIFLALSI